MSRNRRKAPSRAGRPAAATVTAAASAAVAADTAVVAASAAAGAASTAASTTNEPTQTVEGRVKFFNPDKGFGFILPDDGSRDVFVSASTLERSGIGMLENNQRVRVGIRMGHKGPMAQTIELV